MKKYDDSFYRQKYAIPESVLRLEYVENKKTLKEMCSVIGCSSVITASKVLRAYGIDTESVSHGRHIASDMSENELKEFLIKEYVHNRRSQQSIADELGVSNSLIVRYMKRFQINTREHTAKSSNFRNGEPIRNLNSSGYIEIKVFGHPATNSRGYVYEHRYVVEQLFGRYLTSDEVVHHKDMVKSNNEPSNLVCLTNSNHAKLHSLLDKGMSFDEAIKLVEVIVS